MKALEKRQISPSNLHVKRGVVHVASATSAKYFLPRVFTVSNNVLPASFISMYEPLEVFKCEKCRRIIAEPSELIKIVKERTTMEKKQCNDLLRVLESKVKEARTTPSIQSKEYFIPDFEMLYKERCKWSINKFREEHRKSPNLFEKRLAKIAEDYLRRL